VALSDRVRQIDRGSFSRIIWWLRFVQGRQDAITGKCVTYLYNDSVSIH